MSETFTDVIVSEKAYFEVITYKRIRTHQFLARHFHFLMLTSWLGGELASFSSLAWNTKTNLKFSLELYIGQIYFIILVLSNFILILTISFQFFQFHSVINLISHEKPIYKRMTQSKEGFL